MMGSGSTWAQHGSSLDSSSSLSFSVVLELGISSSLLQQVIQIHLGDIP
jgi:hypothetical protein